MMQTKLVLKDPPPLDVLNGDCTQNRTVLEYNYYAVNFWQKNLSVPGGNFSNYFMKIIVFSQLYRSKSATLEIT